MILLLLVAGVSYEVEIARLGDTRMEVRSRARTALAAAGEKAVPALLKALSARDVEVRRGSARILDLIFGRTLKGRRRNEVYSIPDNRKTRRFKGARGRAMQPWILGRRGTISGYSRAYQGVLLTWRSPTLADYNGLLLTLRDFIQDMTDPETSRRNLIESLFAVDAIVSKLRLLGPELGRKEWSTRWAVRRWILPSVRHALLRRGRRLSYAERTVYRHLLDYLLPRCDEAAQVQRKECLGRLPGPGVR